jgi:hypothetical protein
VTGVALQGEVVPDPELAPDELDPASCGPPPDVVVLPPDVLDSAVIVDASEELELEGVVPVAVADSDSSEPDDVEAPEADPLELGPKLVGPTLLELDPLVVGTLDSAELAPLEPGLLIVGLPVSEALPHAARKPVSPQSIAKAVRKCMALPVQKPMPHRRAQGR